VAVATIDCVVALFDHAYDAAAGAVSVTLPPAQNVVAPLVVMTGVCARSTAMLRDDVALQPAAVVTLTETVTVVAPAAGWKNAAAPFAIVKSIVPPAIVQLYVAPAPASATLAEPLLPSQTVDAAVIVASGSAFTVTTTALLVIVTQPRESVTAT
jgi:hypothetical protein